MSCAGAESNRLFCIDQKMGLKLVERNSEGQRNVQEEEETIKDDIEIQEEVLEDIRRQETHRSRSNALNQLLSKNFCLQVGK